MSPETPIPGLRYALAAWLQHERQVGNTNCCNPSQTYKIRICIFKKLLGNSYVLEASFFYNINFEFSAALCELGCSEHVIITTNLTVTFVFISSQITCETIRGKHQSLS